MAHPKATANVASDEPAPEPFVRDRSLNPAAVIDPATAAASGPYAPKSRLEPADAPLDAKWGKPWYLHQPEPILDEAPLEQWAASVAQPAGLEIDSVADSITRVHPLEVLRKTWLEALAGKQNVVSEPEAFARLLAECREAIVELETWSAKVRSEYAAALPPLPAKYLAEATDLQVERLIAGTVVPPSVAQTNAAREVLTRAVALAEQARDRALDAEIGVALARGRATIMAFTRKPKGA
ncbi:MAG: hypothetical protein HYV09_35960 [Deltaproteobacteria bacterium]|nr:hypothetical protein [Deltaproteobacteria bacterium]